MTEQVIFTNEDGEDIRFYVVEETKIAGVNYLDVYKRQIFFCRIFLQCDHTVGFRWAADAVILYEKR